MREEETVVTGGITFALRALYIWTGLVGHLYHAVVIAGVQQAGRVGALPVRPALPVRQAVRALHTSRQWAEAQQGCRHVTFCVTVPGAGSGRAGRGP